MKQVLLAPPYRSTLDTSSEQFVKNRADMLEQLEVIDGLLDEAESGGGEKATERLRSRGKLPVRERIALVLDGRTVLSVADVRANLYANIDLTGNFSAADVQRLVAAITPGGAGR